MKRSIIVGFLILAAAPAFAQGPAVKPRAQKDYRDMIPDHVRISSPAADTVRVINLAPKRLSFLYKASGQWKQATVAPNEFVRLRCTDCGSRLDIAFNNGSVQVNTSTSLGSSYVLSASAQGNAWVLSPAKPFGF